MSARIEWLLSPEAPTPTRRMLYLQIKMNGGRKTFFKEDLTPEVMALLDVLVAEQSLVRLPDSAKTVSYCVGNAEAQR